MRKVNPFQELSRKIYINDDHQNHQYRYSSNKIQTRKYTLLTFLPKSLYIQFLRIANIYFLIIAIISSISVISTIGPITSIIPLVFVLATSIVREAFEDWARYKNDTLTNNQETVVFKEKKKINSKEVTGIGLHFHKVKWQDLVVGDIIRVDNDHQIPADILLLSSSDENGLAYIETANLDGEKNLKVKQAKPEITELLNNSKLEQLKGAMLVNTPNAKLQNFKGVLEITGLSTIYLNYSNFLLRGTHLKNTEYVYGIVVYAGRDSKLLMNQGNYRNKKSHLEKQLNKYIIGLFVLQCIICIVLSILATSSSVKYKENYESGRGARLSYLFPENNPDVKIQEVDGTFLQGCVTFLSFMLLLNTMIPISLMVSLELAKFYQSLFIEYDDLMREGDQSCKVLNMLIHEDLAKIEYIFADKTGTLTTNEMKFMFCSIQGNIYSRQQLTRHFVPVATPTRTPTRAKQAKAEEDPYFHLFWLTISLCHDVVIDKKEEKAQTKENLLSVLSNDKLTSPKHNNVLNLKNHKIHYQGSSPDEVELVETATEAGYVFQEKRGEKYMLLINGEPREFLLVAKIDFNSNRKRMSVVMRDLETNQLFLFCKGADSIILKRVAPETSAELYDKTKEDLKTFSKEGLRTLAVAYKELDEAVFNNWQKRYAQEQQEDFNELVEDDSKNRLKELEEELESNLLLLGATALEDRLQEGVAETISDLHKADIKIWMLTGDKLETAENIGYATSLIAQETRVFKVGTSDIEETLKRYEAIRAKVHMIKRDGNAPFSMKEEGVEIKTHPEKFKSFALIIDGDAITYTFHNEQLKGIFLELIPEFRTVICCRSTPNQKADVVTFVKTNLKKMTLAIGDGGNDVNMIQRADVGVGIFGKEGNQAAFASDYAICKFFFLWRLLLVHGRWSYVRTANFVNFFFYKNLIFTLTQVWFAINSGFSGQSIYDDIYLTNYNSVFTSVAPVYYAAAEQDINPRENETICKAMPYVYAEFRKKNLFSRNTFLFWWFAGLFHSVFIFYAVMESVDGMVDSDGKTFDLWRQSITVLSGIFCTVFSVIIMGTYYYHSITCVCYFIFTLLVFFPIGTYIMDQISTSPNILNDVVDTPKVWFILLLITAALALTIYIPKMYQSFFHPSLVDLLQRDRNKRWESRSVEEFEVKSKRTVMTPGMFDFHGSIMMDSWYQPLIRVKEFLASP